MWEHWPDERIRPYEAPKTRGQGPTSHPLRERLPSYGPPRGQHCRPLGFPPGAVQVGQPPVDDLDCPASGILLDLAPQRPHYLPQPWLPPPSSCRRGHRAWTWGSPLSAKVGVVRGRCCLARIGQVFGALGLRLVELGLDRWTPCPLKEQGCHISSCLVDRCCRPNRVQPAFASHARKSP